MLDKKLNRCLCSNGDCATIHCGHNGCLCALKVTEYLAREMRVHAAARNSHFSSDLSVSPQRREIFDGSCDGIAVCRVNDDVLVDFRVDFRYLVDIQVSFPTSSNNLKNDISSLEISK